MINFRYYIIKKLGEGGNGEVYLVDDRLKNCQRAMKVLSSSRHLDEDMIRKEFSVLSGLFHPHLIRVFDFGVVRQSDEQQFLHRHFYTMEYLEGTNALEYVRCVPLGKEKVELLEDLFIQTLGVIAYIHRKGIIHFDIKPQNLFLVEGHGHHKKTVKLTDFGFSETTVPSVDTAVRGTLEYIAPEIVQGFPIDHRIDLYSLGATFYHLWEGRCPFEASAPVELLRMVVSENLPPLAGVEGVRSLLPQLIERLCRKDPSERFEDARQILSNFASSKYEDSVKETLYFGQRLPFVGRRKEKGVIQEALQALEGGREPTVTSILVIGAQGSGKTELLNEVATEARSRSLLTLKSDRTSANRPFTSIERALRRLDMELCSRDLPSPFRETDDDTIFSPSPSSTGENELADRARRYASHMLRASTQLPILFILDDLPIMDPYSLETVRSIAADDKGGRIVLVASIRDDDADNCPFGDQTTTRIILKELSVDETLALIDSSLGRAFASTNIVQRIHSLYGGIPYIIMEAVTSIANALPLAVLNDPIGLTERGDDLVEFLSLSFEEFFATRFRGLRREKQIILELISCFEIPSPVEILKRVVPFQSDRLIDYLVSLEHQGYVVSHEEQRRFQFRHLKLKEYVYHSIEYDRAALHNFIATTLETLTADIGWSDRNELGRQFRLGNTNAKALEHFEAAGDQARVEGALADADAMYKNALGCLSEDEREVRVSLSLKLAEVYQAKGSDQESITIYEQLLAELSAEDPRCKTINKSLGKGFARLGENAKALHNFQAALHGLVENVDRLEIQQEIISLKIAEGSFDEAIHMGEVQKTLAGSQGDRNFLALVETDLGIAQFYKGSFRESLEAFQRALTIYDNAGNKSKTIDALNNIGNVI
ncbi:MAG: protein kinase, partial [Ignavibacteriales bacterium]|nr:protein kinase [Ignavibacteriales bacterium]